MQHRIVDISDCGARLRSSLQRLVIERDQRPDEMMPFNDVAVLIVAHPQVSYSQSVLSNLSAAGGVFVACDERRHPVGMLLPLAGHFTQTERFAAQASASLPTRKRLWQQIVRISSDPRFVGFTTPLTERCLLGGEQRTLFDTLTRTASSLASVLMDETEVLDLPESLHAAP